MVDRTVPIWIRCFLCTVLCILLVQRGMTQSETNPALLPNNLWGDPSLLPNFFIKDDAVGSSYLSKNWMRGTVEFTNHRRIPLPGEPLFFNFDKINNVLYVLSGPNKYSAYPIDSIASFQLAGSDMDYSFEKIRWISDNFFLMPVIKSTKGYSLYKRLFTKLIRADYSNEGYFVRGRKFDEFVDYYEYYLIYPGNSVYRKLYLKENTVRRALKSETSLVNEFFSLHDLEINEQSLLGMIQYINDKKFPEQ
jgi:hypothetical protein